MFKKAIVPLFATALLISGCGNEPAKGNTKDKVEQNKKGEKNKEAKPLVINEVKINKVNEKTLKVDTKVEGEGVEYAYYIHKGEEVIKKIGYQSNPSLTYDIEGSGTYRVKVYVRDKNGKMNSRFTEEIKVEK
ncbi:triple tyrosine motif-containing protein [Bacillus sp. FSL R10-2201]|uniref:triple tyrosine motif-containing protein n=1 Tax=Bacillus sp. FSL R10-2201 TaxID=2954657 RepID=UPI0030F4F81C